MSIFRQIEFGGGSGPGSRFACRTLALLLLVCAAASADGPPGQEKGSPATRTTAPIPASEFILSPDDVVEVLVFDVPQMSRDYRVSPAGEIVFPLLTQPIKAAGKTPVELSAALADELRKAGMLTNPQVTVAVKDSRLHSVAITGAVKKPQIYQVFGRTTLLDVISQAEGLAPEAGRTAVVTRGDWASRQTGSSPPTDAPAAVDRSVTVDLKALMETGDPALNLDIYPGDRVTVQRAGIIYVVGAVNRPGGFPLSDDHEDITVLKAVALAQDLKATAIRSKSVIIRKNADAPEGRLEIPVDLSQVLSRRAPDISMQPSDILFVPDSPGKKALGRLAEAAIQATTGVIIWRR